MQKNRTSVLIIAIISFSLVIISFFSLAKHSTAVKEYPIIVQIKDDDNNIKTVNLFDNGNDYYIFLPSYSNETNTKFIYKNKAKIIYNEQEITESVFLNEGEYTINYHGENRKLNVLKSENIATMYIDTKKNAESRIYNDKDAKEKVSIVLYDNNGEIDYINNRYEDKISGRGNSTWDQDKRPFNIYLKSNNELLGMHSSKNWALLANSYDSSNIRDYIYKKLAIDSDFIYTPNSKYIDLYINGEYNGLYQLSEKISVEDSKLHTYNDMFLCTFEYWQRWDKLENPINTDECNITVNVTYPQRINDLDYVKTKIQSMENAIVSEDGIDLTSGKKLEEIIDINSWAKAYLIDEITKNLDSNLASSYFYWENDGKIYKGPVWDGDRTLGSDFRNNNPNGFFATRIWRGNENYNQYYNLLMKNEIFKNRMLEIYKQTFTKIIDDLIYNDIDAVNSNIAKASKMNLTRWSDMYLYLKNYQNQEYVDCEDIKDYLLKRKMFLDNNLSNIDDYCNVYLKLDNGSYYIDSIVKGEKYSLPDYKEFDNYRKFEIVNDVTGEEFDLNKQITEDIRIAVKTEEVSYEKESLIKRILNNSKMITAISTFVILIVFLFILIILDRRNSI